MNNDLIYLDCDDFQVCYSFQSICLGKNPRLHQLPPSFGPNTANMLRLFIKFLNLQSLPVAFFRQFETLNGLVISAWVINGAFDNDVLNVLPSVNIFATGGCSTILNVTGHLPRLKELIVDGLPDYYIPDENMYGLHVWRVKIKSTLLAQCFESKSVYCICDKRIKRCTIVITKLKVSPDKYAWSKRISRLMVLIIRRG